MSLSDFYDTGKSSPFGDCRPSGGNPCGRRHRGQDWSHSRQSGTIGVPALLAGRVVSKTRPSNAHGFGYGITIRSEFEGRTLDISYSHGPWGSSQQESQNVGQGQIILHEGLSGFTDGPCVHVEVYVHGVGYVDPMPVVRRILSAQASPAGGGSTTLSNRKDNPMNYIRIQGREGARRGGTYVVFAVSDGYNAEFIGNGGPNNLVEINDEDQIRRLQGYIRGLG